MAWCILGAAVVLMMSQVLGVEGVGSYVAAVYEHHFIQNPKATAPQNHQEALEHMNLNLEVYKKQAAAAAQQHAQIIVFPEDGLHGFGFTRDSIVPYLEMVPDPTAVSWNPCSEPDRFRNTEVQQRLSCMAKSNSLFLVANLPGREDCDPKIPPCPPDGRYQFNTNVAFSADGTLVARYRKRNLYYRELDYFNTPTDPQLITFDTPFAGRFGMFICFDILFYNPAVELVEKKEVGQLILTTAWMNTLPLLDSVQFHRSFSSGTGTTLLAANIRLDGFRMTGSGIYTPGEALYHHARAGEPESGKLLVKTLEVQPHGSTLPPPLLGDQETQPCHSVTAQGSTFTANMMGDSYTMVLLEGGTGKLSVCNNKLHCHLEFTKRNTPKELYALAAFDGLHRGSYRQVCALVRCSDLNPKSCGAPIDHADTLLDFKLMGTFSTRHVFPSVLGSQMQLDHIDQSGWEGRSFYMSRSGMERGLVTAALYGRAYDQDQPQTSTTTSNTSP